VDPKNSDDRSSRVAGTVIDNQEFKIGERLVEHAGNGLPKKSLSVIDRMRTEMRGRELMMPPSDTFAGTSLQHCAM